jgi:alpha-L-arabinofuranosidase
MKSSISILKAFTGKTSFILICILSGFAGFNVCNAQAIVGKWKGGAAKIYYGVEYTKQIGKSMEEKTAEQLGNYTIEFKSDHTFVETFTTPQESKVTIMNGIWNLTGDDLQLTLEVKYNPQKTTTKSTMSINGNTMVTTAVMPANSRIIKMVSTNTRM